MELSEALRTIDATAWLFHQLLQISIENDVAELLDDNGGIGITGAKLYTVVGRDQMPELRYMYKYRSGKVFEGLVPPILPICDLIINTWPSLEAERIRNRLKEMDVLPLALKLIGLDERAISVVKDVEQLGIGKYDELCEGSKNSPILHFELIRITKRLSYALNITEKFGNSEEPSFLVHIGITDEKERKKIDDQLRRLVRFPSIQDILFQLSEMKKDNKIMIPPAESLYKELIRLGMPTTGRGFSQKNLENNYSTYFK